MVNFLFEKLGSFTPVNGSQCLKGKLPLDKKGYCKNLRLMDKGFKLWGDVAIPEGREQKPWFLNAEYQWSATGIVLVKSGFRPPESYYEVSHLCNHPYCLNKEHLRWEIPRDNYIRKNCMTRTTCPCPCGHEFNPCKHDPQCVHCNILNCKYHTQ